MATTTHEPVKPDIERVHTEYESQSHLNRMQSAGAFTISPELFEKVCSKYKDVHVLLITHAHVSTAVFDP